MTLVWLFSLVSQKWAQRVDSLWWPHSQGIARLDENFANVFATC